MTQYTTSLMTCCRTENVSLFLKEHREEIFFQTLHKRLKEKLKEEGFIRRIATRNECLEQCFQPETRLSIDFRQLMAKHFFFLNLTEIATIVYGVAGKQALSLIQVAIFFASFHKKKITLFTVSLI